MEIAAPGKHMLLTAQGAYLSLRMKREPAWPKEVQASLGGPPLTEAQLKALALQER